MSRPSHAYKIHANRRPSKLQSHSEPQSDHPPQPLKDLIRRARLHPRELRPEQVLQLQRTVGNQATLRLLQRKSAAAIEHFGAASIQRQIDEKLKASLGEKGYVDEHGQYMLHRGGNSSGEAVGWKAHIGVKAQSKNMVIFRIAPILKDKYDVMFKFDCNQAESLEKFVTIYPPKDQKDWAPLIQELEASLSGIPVIFEKSTAAVGGGKVAMRHGQINALIPDMVTEAGIEIKPMSAPEALAKVWGAYDPQFYTVDPEKINKSKDQELAYFPKMGALFLVGTSGGPTAAVIWNGIVRGDPRSEANPFNIPLPSGVEPSDKILSLQEQQLETTKIRTDWGIKHTQELRDEGDALITSSNKGILDLHNQKIDRQYQRLATWKGWLDEVERKLPGKDDLRLRNRIENAQGRLAALRKVIADMTRQLETSF